MTQVTLPALFRGGYNFFRSTTSFFMQYLDMLGKKTLFIEKKISYHCLCSPGIVNPKDADLSQELSADDFEERN